MLQPCEAALRTPLPPWPALHRCPLLPPGKRNLPAPLRNRFTELWIGEPPHRSDLSAIAAGYLAGVGAGAGAAAVVDFYLAAKAEAVSWHLACTLPASWRHAGRLSVPCRIAALPPEWNAPPPALPVPPQDTTLQDGAGHKPAYNLRTLCRALEYAAAATPVYGLQVGRLGRG